jgi:hypothetical protein
MKKLNHRLNVATCLAMLLTVSVNHATAQAVDSTGPKRLTGTSSRIQGAVAPYIPASSAGRRNWPSGGGRRHGIRNAVRSVITDYNCGQLRRRRRCRLPVGYS